MHGIKELTQTSKMEVLDLKLEQIEIRWELKVMKSKSNNVKAISKMV
jgi:hypothetical protein